MKSTLCRTYFKCIQRDLDSTFALGLSSLLGSLGNRDGDAEENVD